MKYFKINLNEQYSEFGAKNGVLSCYLHDEANNTVLKQRPTIIVVPGGGYQHCSVRESEPVAFKYFADGYNCFVLNYSVAPHKYPTALVELACAVSFIKTSEQTKSCDSDKIAVIGFSAGGHLAASYSCLYKEVAKKYLQCDSKLLCVSACVLCYPVITSYEFAHIGSFENLCGSDTQLKQQLSLENCVNSAVCPTFVWHSAVDQSVPVQNSLLYTNSLINHNIDCELHIFRESPHGVSTCEREVAETDATKLYVDSYVANWVELSKKFLSRVLHYDKFLV